MSRPEAKVKLVEFVVGNGCEVHIGEVAEGTALHSQNGVVALSADVLLRVEECLGGCVVVDHKGAVADHQNNARTHVDCLLHDERTYSGLVALFVQLFQVVVQ